MSNEERQRILREAGHRPGQAEKESAAAEGKEKLGQQDDVPEADQPEEDRQTPFAEDDPDAPRPRR